MKGPTPTEVSITITPVTFRSSGIPISGKHGFVGTFSTEVHGSQVTNTTFDSTVLGPRIQFDFRRDFGVIDSDDVNILNWPILLTLTLALIATTILGTCKVVFFYLEYSTRRLNVCSKRKPEPEDAFGLLEMSEDTDDL